MAAADTIASLVVSLGLDASQFMSGLKQAESDAAGAGNNIVSGLSSIGGGIVLGGIAAATAGIAGMTAFLGDCAAGAAEAESIQAQLNAVLLSTGGAAGMSADDVNNLAASMQALTTYEDDAVVGAENILLTFTGIGKSVFPEATGAVLDMATAMGMDLNSAALMVGKALNSPTQGISALTRNGVVFTDAQKKMIEAMEKAGNVAGAQKIMLEELGREFGGSAAAAANTFSGQLARLKNILGGVGDMIGSALLPGLKAIGNVVLNFVTSDSFMNFVNSIAGGVTYLVGVITDVVNLLSKGMFKDALEAIQKALELVFGPGSRDVIAGFVSFIRKAIQTVSAIVDFLVKAFQDAAPIIKEAWDSIVSWIGDAWDTIKKAATTVVGIIKKEWQEHGATILARIQQAWGDIVSWLSGTWETIKKTASTVVGVIKSEWQEHVTPILAKIQEGWGAIATWLGTTWETIKKEAARIVGLVKSEWNEHAAGILARIQDGWNGIVSWLGTTWETIKKTATTIVDSIKSAWINHVPAILAAIQNGWPIIVTTVSTFAGNVATVVQEKIDFMRSLWEQHGPAIEALARQTYMTISDIIKSQLDSAITGLQGSFSSIEQFWRDHGANVITIVNWAWGGVTTAIVAALALSVSMMGLRALDINRIWQEHGGTIKGITDATWGAIQSVIDYELNVIGIVVDAWASAINSKFATFGDNIKALWSSIWEAVGRKLEETWQWIVKTIEKGIQGIKDVFVANTNAWIELGRGIVNGIREGISNGWQALKDYVAELARGLLQAAKDALNMHSPSGLFRDEVGLNISLGIAEGIMDGIGAIDNAMGAVMNAVDPRSIIPPTGGAWGTGPGIENWGPFAPEYYDRINKSWLPGAGDRSSLGDFLTSAMSSSAQIPEMRKVDIPALSAGGTPKDQTFVFNQFGDVHTEMDREELMYNLARLLKV